MWLSNLIASSDGLVLHGADVEITGIAEDSRQIEAGNLFVAIPGTAQDGGLFIADALRRGAKAVLCPTKAEAHIHLDVPLVTAPHIRKNLSDLAAAFYPKQPDVIAGVTGTSGKTSTTQFTREIWEHLHYRAGSMGSLGLILPDSKEYSSINTPAPVLLHQRLEKAVGQNVSHFVMEASSHGLAMHRLDNVRFKAGGFTNLSHDHLDYHRDMESYLRAKLRLFAEILPTGGAAVLNADVKEYESFAKIAQNRKLNILGYGKKANEIKLIDIKPEPHGQLFTLDLFGKRQQIMLPVIGAFQVWNSLCALGMVIGCGGDTEKALEALGHVSGVLGRLQQVGTTKSGGAVFVDYAHKPDALENVLKALRPHAAAHEGRLGVVFGCGGNRDKTKRPVMGKIAQQFADWVIVTDDNPRHEDPNIIRHEILAGCMPGKALREIADRATAIKEGISQLGPHDILIIAGKGHERGQIIGDEVLPFDDAEVAKKVLQQ